MALLHDLVRKHGGYVGAARNLGMDRRTVASWMDGPTNGGSEIFEPNAVGIDLLNVGRHYHAAQMPGADDEGSGPSTACDVSGALPAEGSF